MNIYDQHLDRNPANFAALSPVSFVERSAEVFGDLPAVIHGQRRYTWAQCRDRSARLAAALQDLGVTRGTTVSVMLSNTPEMVEVHYAVPALNAVLNTLNTRLDASLLAWQMAHCEATVLITDREFAPTMAPALHALRQVHGRDVVVIDVSDSEYTGPGDCLGTQGYEELLAAHAPAPDCQRRGARLPSAAGQRARRRGGSAQRGCHRHSRSDEPCAAGQQLSDALPDAPRQRDPDARFALLKQPDWHRQGFKGRKMPDRLVLSRSTWPTH